MYAYPYGVSYPSQEAEIRQVDKVLPEQQRSSDFSRQPEVNERPTSTKPVVQFCGTTPENKVIRPDSESRQDTTAKVPAHTPETGSTELELIETVYHTARRDNSSYREEPVTEPAQRSRERKVLQYDSKDSDDDVSERQYRKGTAETDAKVGSTQHSPPKRSNSSSQNVSSRTADRTSRHKKRQSTSTPRSTSTENRRRDRKKNSSRDDEPYSPSDASMDSSSEGEVVSPRHIRKPPKFDGQCSFETFMVQFSNCAEYNKWNEAQKLAHLRNVLEKDAATILWDYGPGTTTSWKGLTEILETRFGGKAMAEKYRIELRNRRRTADETLHSLHSDIRRLAALAYKGIPPEMRDQVTCDSFLDALADPEFAFKIRERQLTDLDSAIRIALQLEVWVKEMNRHRETTRPERGESRRVREINRKPESNRDQDTENSKKYTGYGRGAPGNQNTAAYAGGYRPPAATRYVTPNAHGGPAGPPNPSGRYPANYGRAEPAQSSNRYGNRNGNFYQAPNLLPVCFNCGDPTHRVRECPARPDRPSAPPPQATAPQQPDVRPMKKRSNDKDKQEKTCIRVRYRHHKLSALIDTGSDVSIAGEDVARNMGWPIYAHRTKEVSIANNKTMPILGATHVVLFVAGHGVESEVLIAPDLVGLILGINWLSSQGRIK